MKCMYATKNEHSRIINEKMMKTMITMTIMLMALIILAEKVSTLPYLRDSRGEDVEDNDEDDDEDDDCDDDKDDDYDDDQPCRIYVTAREKQILGERRQIRTTIFYNI